MISARSIALITAFLTTFIAQKTLAVGVSSLVIFINVENCVGSAKENCTTSFDILPSDTDKNYTLSIQKYGQLPSGIRAYEPIPESDRLYSVLEIEGVDLIKPFTVPANVRRTVKIRALPGASRLKGKDTAFAFVLQETRDTAKDSSEKNNRRLKIGVDVLTTITIRADLMGLPDSGRVKISPDIRVMMHGRLFQKFVLTNSKSISLPLELDARVKSKGLARKDQEKRIVLFESMIPHFVEGKKDFRLTVSPGSTVNLYVPIDGLEGKAIQISGRVVDGSRIASRVVRLDDSEISNKKSTQ
jgi:hypothetical protein